MSVEITKKEKGVIAGKGQWEWKGESGGNTSVKNGVKEE